MSRSNRKFNEPPAKCQICGQGAPAVQLVPAALVRPVVAELIARRHPDWSTDGFICEEDLNVFRNEYVQSLLKDERGELSDLDREVMDSLRTHELIVEHIDDEFEQRLSIGQRVADRVASFGGSWTFIIIFGCVLVVWMLVNSIVLMTRAFDPFPYILLNLVLSCLAAIQAPIIMMSQNRQEARDRDRAAHDYQVNLKAELEIRQLHQKIDHLLSKQWERLVEIQEVQIELMNELATRK